MRIAAVLLCVLAWAGAAGGDASPDPRTPEQAADAALAAFEAKDEAAEKALAETDDPDPWLVADELLARGEHAAALAFATASPRKDTEELARHLSTKDAAEAPALRRALGRVRERARAKDAEGMLEALEAVEARDDGVVAVLLDDFRGWACGALFDQPTACVPSGTTWVELRETESRTGKRVLALGDPTYDARPGDRAVETYRGGALRPLPATRPEAIAIGDEVLLGDEAAETGLAEALKGERRWRAVHLACHGLVDTERPLLSSLALTRGDGVDGFLTCLDIFGMDVPADLVVLSACETARGKVAKAEGIVGLTRAFMYAGAPRVLCSLWKVDDDATRALMTRFYELWNPRVGEGLPAAEALRKAQAFVRGHEKWAHPYCWAAWVLWGLP